MPAFLHSIRTAVPEHAYTQQEAVNVMLAPLEEGSRAARLVNRIYNNSGIDKRHSVIDELKAPRPDGVFFDGDGAFRSPTTKERNDVYAREARKLFKAAAESSLASQSDFKATDVTHVITVSCTGFFAPGPDYYLVKDLGLRPETQRFHVGFMGCYAAFPALKMARAFCESDPDAVVLVVCLELCSLHLEPSEEIDDILAFSVFADGAAAALVSGRKPGVPALAIEALESTIAPDSEGDMAWSIGNNGFQMVLSTYVPRILEANVAGIVDPLLGSIDRSRDDIQHWAIHPGGRAILDKVSSGLDLPEDSLTSSRRVLSNYGNMSSATILFVLNDMIESGVPVEHDSILAMAFGPGLTVESGLFERV